MMDFSLPVHRRHNAVNTDENLDVTLDLTIAFSYVL